MKENNAQTAKMKGNEGPKGQKHRQSSEMKSQKAKKKAKMYKIKPDKAKMKAQKAKMKGNEAKKAPRIPPLNLTTFRI